MEGTDAHRALLRIRVRPVEMIDMKQRPSAADQRKQRRARAEVGPSQIGRASCRERELMPV